MVPTLEAIITLQMLYSAVPPIGIASARLAMLPPVMSDLTCDRVVLADRFSNRGSEAHFTYVFFPFL